MEKEGVVVLFQNPGVTTSRPSRRRWKVVSKAVDIFHWSNNCMFISMVALMPSVKSRSKTTCNMASSITKSCIHASNDTLGCCVTNHSVNCCRCRRLTISRNRLVSFSVRTNLSDKFCTNLNISRAEGTLSPCSSICGG